MTRDELKERDRRRIEQRKRIHEIYERRRIKRYNSVIASWKARGWL